MSKNSSSHDSARRLANAGQATRAIVIKGTPDVIAGLLLIKSQSGPAGHLMMATGLVRCIEGFALAHQAIYPPNQHSNTTIRATKGLSLFYGGLKTLWATCDMAGEKHPAQTALFCVAGTLITAGGGAKVYSAVSSYFTVKENGKNKDKKVNGLHVV